MELISTKNITCISGSLPVYYFWYWWCEHFLPRSENHDNIVLVCTCSNIVAGTWCIQYIDVNYLWLSGGLERSRSSESERERERERGRACWSVRHCID